MKLCKECLKEVPPSRKDGFCRALCKKKFNWREVKRTIKGRNCDPNHGWF